MLEGVGESFKLPIGHADAATGFAPIVYGAADLAQNLLRPRRRDAEIGITDKTASIVMSGPVSSEIQVFISRSRSGDG